MFPCAFQNNVGSALDTHVRKRKLFSNVKNHKKFHEVLPFAVESAGVFSNKSFDENHSP